MQVGRFRCRRCAILGVKVIFINKYLFMRARMSKFAAILCANCAQMGERGARTDASGHRFHEGKVALTK